METIGKILVKNGEVVEIERGKTEQGYVYKNFEAYESGNGICYIPELSDTTYDRQYFKDEFGKYADEVFETIDWQSPWSYYNELLDDIKERKDSKADLEKRRDELLSELYWVLHDLEDEEGYIHESLTTTLINRIFTIDDVLDLIVEKENENETK